MIDLHQRSRWLFAGLFKVLGCTSRKKKGYFFYNTFEIESLNKYVGRIVVGFRKGFRQSYPYFETAVDDMEVVEMKPEKMAAAVFPGFNNVAVSHRVLKSIVGMDIVSWRSILSNVKGVYAIVDRSSGKVYVGSATGEEMIWKRWSNYARTGHGGNKGLIELLDENGPEHAMNFQYAILEIADSHASDDDILKRESHWKNVLCSREHGLNEN